jgi:Toastrack DUF4097
MRRRVPSAIPGAFPLALLTLLTAFAPAPAAARAAETTRTLRAELPADVMTGPFSIENLAGTMTVTRGGGPGVLAVATVHAESDALAAAVRFERVTGKDGHPALRVRYPLDDHPVIRYPRKEGAAGHVASFFGLGDRSKGTYDGHKVTVSDGGGVLLYADLEVQLPPREVTAIFRSLAGPQQGRGVQGTLTFDTHSGDVRVEDAGGRIKADTGSGDVQMERIKGTAIADTGSGDVRATGVNGSFDCDTGSGDCVVVDFDGDTISCDTGSGNVSVRGARARSITADTGSGNVGVTETDVEEVRADTGSGNVIFSARGDRLARLIADTGSGNVTLRLGPQASFEVLADQGSGDLVSRYADAVPILKKKELIGYRRGDGRARISVDTGSGNVVIEPGGEAARNGR